MLKTKKMFVFDMDGTILNSNDKILDSTISMIKKLKKIGHKIIIATGRPYMDAYEDLKNHEKLFDCIILNNGSYFKDVKKNKFFYESFIPKKIVKHAYKVAHKNNAYLAVHNKINAFRCSFVKRKAQAYWKIFFPRWKQLVLPKKQVKKIMKQNQIIQISIGFDPKKIIFLKKYFLDFQDQVEIHISSEIYLDINIKNTNKWNKVKKVSKYLNIDKKDIICFGDSGNDYQMLKFAPESFAMQNANDLIKKVAKKIIGSNNSNAIAQELEKFI